MSKLSSSQRKDLPKGSFAGPNKSYPIENKAHARMALAMVAKYGTPAEKAEVHAKVAK